MGAWGIGLYSSDFVLDVRGAVKAVARLPFPPDRLLEYLCASQPAAANDLNDPDHTVFWLTVADQFAKRGIDCADARNRALAIIKDGIDLAAMAALGMDEKSLAKRRAMLEEVRRRIAAPTETAKPRAVIKAPQRLLLKVGEVLIYPVCKGKPINPYAVGKDWAWVKAWQQDGWGAFMVVERGHVFDFLAWYRPLVITEPLPAELTLAELARPRMWLLEEPGTLTARHYANMQLKSLGCISIDPARLAEVFRGAGRRGSVRSTTFLSATRSKCVRSAHMRSAGSRRVIRPGPSTAWPILRTLNDERSELLMHGFSGIQRLSSRQRFAPAVADDCATLASRRCATTLPGPVFHRRNASASPDAQELKFRIQFSPGGSQRTFNSTIKTRPDVVAEAQPEFRAGLARQRRPQIWAGQPDIAMEHAEAALRLSPHARVSSWLGLIGTAHFVARRFNEAVPKLLLAIQDDPTFSHPYQFIAACYTHMGRLDDARAIVGRLRAITSVAIPDTSYLRKPEHRELP